jgi:hypothetical protein
MDTSPSSAKDLLPNQDHDPAAAGPPVASQDGKPANLSIPAVRFSSAVEEIAPGAPEPTSAQPDEPSVFTEVAADQLKAFSQSIRDHPRALQERRINTFQFEPVSLPASRVCQ